MLNRALDFFFPPQCLSCQALVPAHGTLCLACWKSVPFIADPMCACCGLPFEYSLGEGALCGGCLKETPPYARARAVFVYNDASRKLVHKLKYNDQLHLAAVYSVWLAKAAGDMLKTCDVIVPVPLSWRRFVGRRYNQAALLAEALSENCGLPVLPDALTRHRHTPPQTGLSRAQREKNVAGAFKMNPKYKKSVEGKTVLLMDDVMTTGATLSHCARALLKAQAKEVNVLTLARTTYLQ